MERLPVPFLPALSSYERHALGEIALWKAPDRMGWFGGAVRQANRVLHEATDVIRKVPGVAWTLDTFVAGLLRLTNEITQDSVWHAAIYEDYRTLGHPVHEVADITGLGLDVVDQALAGLDLKYRALAAAEGAATGYAGLPGIAPDIAALVALSLRAVGEHAVYCGFDLSSDAERLFVLEILNAVSQPSDVAKEVALAPVIRVTRKLAQDQALLAAEQLVLARALQTAARSIGVHLTRAKLAQVVPVLGGAVGATFNAYYVSKVCDAAFYLYRERFLLRKYGPAVLDATAPPR